MKRLLGLSTVFLLAALGLGAAQVSKPQPMTCTDVTAWLIGGISTDRLTQLVSQRGIAFSLSPDNEKQLRAAGAEAPLIRAIRNIQIDIGSSPPCSPALAKTAELTRQKQFQVAERRSANSSVLNLRTLAFTLRWGKYCATRNNGMTRSMSSRRPHA